MGARPSLGLCMRCLRCRWCCPTRGVAPCPLRTLCLICRWRCLQASVWLRRCDFLGRHVPNHLRLPARPVVGGASGRALLASSCLGSARGWCLPDLRHRGRAGVESIACWKGMSSRMPAGTPFLRRSARRVSGSCIRAEKACRRPRRNG